MCMCTPIPSHPPTERLLLPLLKAEKIVSFIPPDGSFTLLNYHLGSSRYSQPPLRCPFRSPLTTYSLLTISYPTAWCLSRSV